MSDYWKSVGKWWCKYCRIYVTDNKASRQIHEAGEKHKENMQKYIEAQRKKAVVDQREELKQAKELRKLEHMAMVKYGKDVGTLYTDSEIQSMLDKKYGTTKTTSSAANVTSAANAGKGATAVNASHLYGGGSASSIDGKRQGGDIHGFNPTKRCKRIDTALAPPTKDTYVPPMSMAKHVQSDRANDPYGHWSVVAPSSDSHLAQPTTITKAADAEEEDADELELGDRQDDLKSFKVVERTLSLQAPDMAPEDAGLVEEAKPPVGFKRRAVDAGKKKRNRRIKKHEDYNS